MTDRHVGRVATQYSRSNVFPVKNAGAQEIPPFGCVQVVSDPVQGVTQVGRPTSLQGLFFAAGPRAVPVNKASEVFLWDRPRKVLLGGVYAAGTTVGPVENSFEMTTTGSGFVVVHPPADAGSAGLVLPAGASGGSSGVSEDPCPCECVSGGDVTASGVITTSKKQVTFPELVWPGLFGNIYLSAGTYELVWNPTRELWVWDIGQYLEAKYADGSDASTVTVMDGEITLSVPPYDQDCCTMSELQVCVTGEVPQPGANVAQNEGFSLGYSTGYSAGAGGLPFDDSVSVQGQAYPQQYQSAYQTGYSRGFADGEATVTPPPLPTPVPSGENP